MNRESIELEGRKLILFLVRDTKESAVEKRLHPHNEFSRRRSRVTSKGSTHVEGVLFSFWSGRVRDARAHPFRDPSLGRRPGSSEVTTEFLHRAVGAIFVPLPVKRSFIQNRDLLRGFENK